MDKKSIEYGKPKEKRYVVYISTVEGNIEERTPFELEVVDYGNELSPERIRDVIIDSLKGLNSSEVNRETIELPKKRKYHRLKRHKKQTWTKSEINYCRKEIRMSGFSKKTIKRVAKDLRRTVGSVYMRMYRINKGLE